MGSVKIMCGLLGVRLLPFAVCLLLAPTIYGQSSQKKSAEPVSPVIFPVDPKPPTPPPPTPGAAIQLGSDQIYVVETTTDAIVLSSPVGIVKVAKEAAPIKIRGKFPSGDGSYETKTFNGGAKWVFLIEPAAKGSCELIIVPAGAAEADIVRRPIVVLDGPAPPPGPGPAPPVDPLTKALQDAYNSETDSQKSSLAGVLVSVFKVAVPTAHQDASVTTLAKLEAKIHNGTDALVGAGKMAGVRKVASEYIAGKMPKLDQTMTDALWQTAAGAYADVAAAMAKVKAK